MPKHAPPNDDGALLDLERELLALDRAILLLMKIRKRSPMRCLIHGTS